MPARKEIIFDSLKNYSVDVYKEASEKLSIPNYDSFDNLDLAYSDFISRLQSVIIAVAATKTVKIKGNIWEWFDWKIDQEIHKGNALYKKLKLAKPHVGKDI